MQGYVKAEIIYKLGTTISRGFGFVTFDCPENAKELLNKTIVFKERVLRFTQYMVALELTQQPEKHIVPMQVETSKNLIIVKNVGDMTRNDVYEFFSNFGNVGKHFIMTDHETGVSKNYAIVEMTDKDVYECLIKLKEVKFGTQTLEIARWKLKKCTKEKPITKNDLFNAFIAGKNVGMIEGLKRKHNIVVNK
jgi:RNA recognition motif-containing protein